jgi:hypothetical protein
MKNINLRKDIFETDVKFTAKEALQNTRVKFQLLLRSIEIIIFKEMIREHI